MGDAEATGVDGGNPAQSPAGHGPGGLPPARAAVVVALVGVLVTLAVSLSASTLNRHNEHRLLEVQTRQAAAVLGTTIQSLGGVLNTALQLGTVTQGSVAEFDQFGATVVGAHRPFVTAVLLQSAGGRWQPVAVVGSAPLLDPASPQAQSLVTRAATSRTFVVVAIPAATPRRIGYAVVSKEHPTIAVYVERAIPINRVVPVENTSAFSDLNFATYFGDTTATSSLATTNLPLDQLPMTGDSVRMVIPFGNSSVTLVTSPRAALGGALGGILPVVILIGGLLLTLVGALLTYQLVRRQANAESDAQTIAVLYEELDGLYDAQRSISETLQRALLPKRNPAVPNIEVASRYIAGADGVDIGGDWYSFIDIDERHFAFAIGDVSGKGVDAAAVMARLRFTVRAYLMEGHAPDVVLEMCSRQLSVNEEGHMATVLVGVGDPNTGIITLANAGHLNPLIVTASGTSFLPTSVGLPLGVAESTYGKTTVQLANGSTLVAFTDGLVEQRGECIDVGLDRLVAAAEAPVATVEALLGRLIASREGAGSDDIALLGFRWTRPSSPLPERTRVSPSRYVPSVR